MILSLSLNNEQKNIQKIGPAMVHSLNILQMNVADLYDLVMEESKRNPSVEPLDTDGRYSNGGRKEAYLESMKDRPSIEEYLLDQVPDWPQEKKDILLELVYKLDENGFYSGDFEKIATKLHASSEQVRVVSDELKNLRPYGLGARNLQEALIIQTKNILTDEGAKSEIIRIIEKHLDDILNGFFKKISQEEQLPVSTIEKIGHFILRLNFSPLSFFHSEDSIAIIPDVRIFKRDDNWIVEVNDSYYPKLRFSKMYKEIYSKPGEDEAKKYLKDCAKHARLLSNAIDKRNSTLYNVARSILEHQKQFFEFGPQWMRGLSLKEIADELDINISTVSRAILDKYVDTPFGIKKMSTFFDSSVNGYSSTFIKTEIKNILKNKGRGLSDQKIADMLGERGIKVARRTIAKYRKEDNLPNSRIRKIVQN